MCMVAALLPLRRAIWIAEHVRQLTEWEFRLRSSSCAASFSPANVIRSSSSFLLLCSPVGIFTVCRDIVVSFLAAIRRSLVSLPAKVRTKTLGNLADAVAIEWPIAVSIAVPIDQEIVACPARQDVDVNMQDRLPGEFAVGLN